MQIRHEAGSVYEYRKGEPTWLAAGMLLETMSIAATAWQRQMVCEQGSSEAPHSMTVRFLPSTKPDVDPLLSFLTLRSVGRYPYRRRALSVEEKKALQSCLSDDVAIDWHEGLGPCAHFAKLCAAATAIRLRCPEAFAVHQRMIDWDRAQSPSAIPARATGLSRPTLLLMRWALQRWRRTQWVNRLGGTFGAALQIDYLPGIRSAAYLVLRRAPENAGRPADAAELMAIGRDIQRFWLTATRLGLAMQPVLATLAFADYGERQIQFSKEPGLSRRAERLAGAFRQAIGVSSQEVVFIGRIGEPSPRLPIHRSSRRPLAELMS